MNRRVLFLLLIVIYLPRMLFASAADDVFSENLAKLIGAPASALRPLAEAYSGCGQADPEGAIATFGELTREAAAFATSETLAERFYPPASCSNDCGHTL